MHLPQVRAKFGGMQTSEATRLRDIESENANCKFHDKCRNEQWFESLAQARREIARLAARLQRGAASQSAGLPSRQSNPPPGIANALAMHTNYRRSSSLHT